ncbi:seven-hairpin glycosidase, partial [Phlegmacium glaucopus]
PSDPPSKPSREEQDIWEPRKNEVKDAFGHAWSGYRKMAFPNDELLLLTGGKSNKLRYYHYFPHPNLHSLKFNTKVQWLGSSLISAYALSAKPVLLHHAERVGQILLPAFNGTKSALPESIS